MRVQQSLLQLQSVRVEGLEQDLRLSKSKVWAQQLDLDRWAAKNQEWAKEMVQKVMNSTQDSPQEWPRAQGWKKYQESLKAQEQASELNQESDRQQAEKQQWKQW